MIRRWLQDHFRIYRYFDPLKLCGCKNTIDKDSFDLISSEYPKLFRKFITKEDEMVWLLRWGIIDQTIKKPIEITLSKNQSHRIGQVVYGNRKFALFCNGEEVEIEYA